MRTYSLDHLSDAALLRDLSALVARERTALAAVLAHIAEVIQGVGAHENLILPRGRTVPSGRVVNPARRGLVICSTAYCGARTAAETAPIGTPRARLPPRTRSRLRAHPEPDDARLRERP